MLMGYFAVRCETIMLTKDAIETLKTGRATTLENDAAVLRIVLLHAKAVS
jgi:hypothetical protein